MIQTESSLSVFFYTEVRSNDAIAATSFIGGLAVAITITLLETNSESTPEE